MYLFHPYFKLSYPMIKRKSLYQFETTYTYFHFHSLIPVVTTCMDKVWLIFSVPLHIGCVHSSMIYPPKKSWNMIGPSTD